MTLFINLLVFIFLFIINCLNIDTPCTGLIDGPLLETDNGTTIKEYKTKKLFLTFDELKSMKDRRCSLSLTNDSVLTILVVSETKTNDVIHLNEKNEKLRQYCSHKNNETLLPEIKRNEIFLDPFIDYEEDNNDNDSNNSNKGKTTKTKLDFLVNEVNLYKGKVYENTIGRKFQENKPTNNQLETVKEKRFELIYTHTVKKSANGITSVVVHLLDDDTIELIDPINSMTTGTDLVFYFNTFFIDNVKVVLNVTNKNRSGIATAYVIDKSLNPSSGFYNVGLNINNLWTINNYFLPISVNLKSVYFVGCEDDVDHCEYGLKNCDYICDNPTFNSNALNEYFGSYGTVVRCKIYDIANINSKEEVGERILNFEASLYAETFRIIPSDTSSFVKLIVKINGILYLKINKCLGTKDDARDWLCCSGSKVSLEKCMCNDGEFNTDPSIYDDVPAIDLSYPTTCYNIPCGATGGYVNIKAEEVYIEDSYIDLAGLPGLCVDPKYATGDYVCSGSGAGGKFQVSTNKFVVTEAANNRLKLNLQGGSCNSKEDYLASGGSGGEIYITCYGKIMDIANRQGCHTNINIKWNAVNMEGGVCNNGFNTSGQKGPYTVLNSDSFKRIKCFWINPTTNDCKQTDTSIKYIVIAYGVLCLLAIVQLLSFGYYYLFGQKIYYKIQARKKQRSYNQYTSSVLSLNKTPLTSNELLKNELKVKDGKVITSFSTASKKLMNLCGINIISLEEINNIVEIGQGSQSKVYSGNYKESKICIKIYGDINEMEYTNTDSVSHEISVEKVNNNKGTFTSFNLINESIDTIKTTIIKKENININKTNTDNVVISDETSMLDFLNKKLATDINNTKISDYNKAVFREILTLSMLRSPQVPRLYGVAFTDKYTLLCMDLCTGGSLEKLIKEVYYAYKLKYITEKHYLLFTLKWAIQIASALSELHDRGLMSRDLKPDNILMKYPVKVPKSSKAANSSWINSISAMLVDFGISKTVDETNTKSRAFSLFWAAPESYIGKSTQKSDVYSFGVCIFASLNGSHPFANTDVSPSRYISTVRKTGLHLDMHKKYPCLNYNHQLTNLLNRMWDCNPQIRPDIKSVLKSLQTIFLSYSDKSFRSEQNEIAVAII